MPPSPRRYKTHCKPPIPPSEQLQMNGRTALLGRYTAGVTSFKPWVSTLEPIQRPHPHFSFHTAAAYTSLRATRSTNSCISSAATSHVPKAASSATSRMPTGANGNGVWLEAALSCAKTKARITTGTWTIVSRPPDGHPGVRAESVISSKAVMHGYKTA
jgi:hypothetical protein